MGSLIALRGVLETDTRDCISMEIHIYILQLMVTLLRQSQWIFAYTLARQWKKCNSNRNFLNLLFGAFPVTSMSSYLYNENNKNNDNDYYFIFTPQKLGSSKARLLFQILAKSCASEVREVGHSTGSVLPLIFGVVVAVVICIVVAAQNTMLLFARTNSKRGSRHRHSRSCCREFVTI